MGKLFVTCGSVGHISETQPRPKYIAVDVAPSIQIKDYMCMLHVRHYDNQQADTCFPTRLELSSSQMDWNLLKYVPQEVLCGYTIVKLLRSLAKTFENGDSNKRTFKAEVILSSHMVKTSILWILDPDDKFKDGYKWIRMDEMSQPEEGSTYKDDVLFLCRHLIDHSRCCNLKENQHTETVPCLSVEDVMQLQGIADKSTGFPLHLSSRDRTLPYVLMTQCNAAHHHIQNGFNEAHLMEKVYHRLASQGIPQLNTEDEVIYNRGYYLECDRDMKLANTKDSFLSRDLYQEGERHPDISLEMARKGRVWALRALRLIVELLSQNDQIKNYYLPRQLIHSPDVHLTLALCEAFIAILE